MSNEATTFPFSSATQYWPRAESSKTALTPLTIIRGKSLNCSVSQAILSWKSMIIEDASIIIDFQLKMAWETEQLRLFPLIIVKGVNAVFDDSARGQYWVAEEKGNVVASLLITYEWSDWRNCYVWWFQSVYEIGR